MIELSTDLIQNSLFFKTKKNDLAGIEKSIDACAIEHIKSLIKNDNVILTKKILKIEFKKVLQILKLGDSHTKNINLCEERVAKLNNVLNELTLCPVMVKSVFPSSKDCNSSDINEYVTPAYDVLKIIFGNTNQQFRQRHYQQLIERYYNKLSENSKEILNDLSKREFKAHVDFLLPYVKLEYLMNANSDGKPIDKELLDDFFIYVKHPRFSKEDVFEVIRSKFNSSEYELISFNLQPLDEQRGHLGQYFHLNIVLKFNGNTEKIRLFLKYINQENNVLQTLTYGASLNEAFFYEELLKEFQKLGLQDILTFAPKCYLSKASDLLVLDDMKSLGFKDIDHYTTLSYKGIKLIALQLARYHSCSFILENSLTKLHGRKVELDELYGKNFKELIFLSEGPSRKSFESFWDSIYYLIDLFKTELQYKISVEEFKEKANNIFKDTFYEKLLKKSSQFRNCICHGDLYASNTMLKEHNGSNVEGCLLDFQTMRYLPPAHDVLLLIYLNTTKTVRDECMNKVLDDYYMELSRNIQIHGLDISEIYTKKQFMESIQYMKPQVIIQAFMYSHALKVPPELKKDLFGGKNHVYYLIMNRIKLVQRSMVSELFRNNQKDFVQDLYELCK